jgi:hypothetical protein
MRERGNSGMNRRPIMALSGGVLRSDGGFGIVLPTIRTTAMA